MFRVALKGLLGHKLRFALTTLSVVLGVAFVAGTYALTDSMDRAFSDLFGDIFESIDVTVLGRDPAAEAFPGPPLPGQRPPIPESLLDEIAALEHVDRVEPVLEGFAQFVDRDGEVIGGMGPPTIGFAWNDAGVVTIREGRPPADAGEVTMDLATAEEFGFAIGDTVTVLLRDGTRSHEIVGLTGFGTEDSLLGATMATFTLPEAQSVFGLEGQLHEVAAFAVDGVSPAELRDEIEALVGSDGVAVETGSARAEDEAAQVRDLLSFFTTILLVFGGVALFVGAFIIANTFSIVVAQRSREFALLRAVGASARQVRSAVTVEAAVIGLLASVLGIAAGVGLSIGLRAVMDAFGLALPDGGIVVRGRTVVVSLVIGIGVTLLASIGPARRAAHVPPVAAMRDTGEVVATSSRRRILAGAVATVAGLVLLLVGLVGGGGIWLVGIGAAATLAGVALLAPLAADPVAAVLGAVPRRLGVTGLLAQRNARRSPVRTAATASALMIGLALVSFVTILAASVSQSAASAIGDQFRADFIVSSAVGGEFGGSLQPGLAGRIAERPEVAAVSSLRFSPALVGGESVMVTGIRSAAIESLVELDVGDGALTDLAGDTMFVHVRELEARDLALGDALDVTFIGGETATITIVGTHGNDDLVGRWLADVDTLDRYGATGFELGVYVSASGDVDDAFVAIEDVTAAFPGVRVQNQAEFRQSQQDQINQVLALMIVLLVLAVLIALLGITNTLALAVFERTREIGLLRAVGMLRRQTRRMVLTESVIIAVFGALLGVVVGAVFGWAVVHALAEEGVRHLVLPVGQLVLYLVVAGVAGAVAGVFPAWRAARLDVLRAVTTE